MQMEIASVNKLLDSRGGERQKGVKLDKNKRNRNRRARFSVGRKRTVGIENSEFRTAKFQSDRTHFERLDSLSARSLDGVCRFPY